MSVRLMAIPVGMFVVELLTQAAIANDAQVATVFAEVRANIQSIGSIRFEMYPERGAEFVEYFHDHGMFRANIYLRSDGAAQFARATGQRLAHDAAKPSKPTRVPDMSVAFDGERYYQKFGKEHFTHSAVPQMRNPVGQLSPLIEPYAWVFESDDIKTLSALKGDQIWSKRLEDARYLGDEVLDDHAVSVIEVRRKSPERIDTIYFAKNLRFTPIKWVSRSSDGRTTAACRLADFFVDESTGVKAFVPTRMDYDNYSRRSDEPQTFSVSLDETSLKVNAEMPVDLFTLAPAGAKIVEDLDVPPPDLRAGTSPAAHETTHLSRTWILMILNTVVLVLVLFVVAWRQKQRDRTGGDESL